MIGDYIEKESIVVNEGIKIQNEKKKEKRTLIVLTIVFLVIAAPSTPDTSAQISYINTAESCIETAFAVLVGSLAAAAIGEAVFRKGTG